MLLGSGYAEVGFLGPFGVLVKREGRPGCVYVAEDWPMILAFRREVGLRAITLEGLPSGLRPPLNVIVRRGDDLEPLGEGKLLADMTVEPPIPTPGTWALLDYVTPAGPEVSRYVAEAVLASGIAEVVLVRYYTSRVSAKLLRSYHAPRGPLLVPAVTWEDGQVKVSLSIPGQGGLRSEYLDPSSAAQELRRALGRGC